LAGEAEAVQKSVRIWRPSKRRDCSSVTMWYCTTFYLWGWQIARDSFCKCYTLTHNPGTRFSFAAEVVRVFLLETRLLDRNIRFREKRHFFAKIVITLTRGLLFTYF
jgi:hypothetical protein